LEVRNVADCAGVPMEFVADLPPTAYEDLAERIVMGDRRVMRDGG